MTTQEYSIVQDDTLGQTILFQGQGGTCVTLMTAQDKDRVCEPEQLFKLARPRYNCVFKMNDLQVECNKELEIKGSRNVFKLANAISTMACDLVVQKELGILLVDRGLVVIHCAHITKTRITVHLGIADRTHNLVQVWGPPPA